MNSQLPSRTPGRATPGAFVRRCARHLVFSLLAVAGHGAELQLTGPCRYEAQNNGQSVAFHADSVRNNGATPSNALRLELWATNTPYAGGALAGYRLAAYRLEPLAGGMSHTRIASGTMPSASRPTGLWYVSLVLTEYTGESSNNGGFVRRDSVNFDAMLDFGLGNTTPWSPTDDHGNTLAVATAVELDTTVSGRIDFDGDIDTFRLVAPGAGTLTLFSTGSTDTTAELLDANGEAIASNDDGTDRNFSISRTVTAGTYYLAVRHFSIPGTGDYRVAFQFAASGTTAALRKATTPGRLINLSVRSAAMAGDQALIVGCVLAGSGSKSLLVRGVGPGLAAFNVNHVLPNPELRVFCNGALRVSNDDWSRAPNFPLLAPTFARLGAFALASGSGDAAILDNFPAGACTMKLTGSAGGVALLEVYDADMNPSSSGVRLVNLSARTHIGAGEGALFAGFVIAGGPQKVLIRGIGGSLGTFGVAGVLADPLVRLYQGGTLLAESDDWASSPEREQLEATARSVGAFALASPLDAAMVVTLQPGAYTVQVAGYGNSSGVGLVEIYEVP